MRPLAIELFAGLHGWGAGLSAAGFRVVGFDIADMPRLLNHPVPEHCSLVLQDVLTLHGSQFRDAHLIVASPPCFVADTLILTSRGMIPIPEVLPGDLVLTHRKRWRKVIRTGSTFASTVVAKGYGGCLEGTTEHPVYARRNEGSVVFWNKQSKRPDYKPKTLGQPEWIGLGSMEGAHWGTPAEIEALPIPDLPNGLPDAPEFWWMVGRWIGDGWVRFRHKTRSGDEVMICCGKSEADELERRLAAFNPASKRAKLGELRWRRSEERTTIRFTAASNSLAAWLVANFGKGAQNKSWPAWVFGMDPALRQALLDGYVSADGSEGMNSGTRIIRTATISKRLAIGTRMLAASLGHAASLFFTRRPKTCEIEGRVSQQEDTWNTNWTPDSGSNRLVERSEGILWGLVREVSPGQAVAQVWNLEVEEDNSYVAEGFIVHNCQEYSYMAMPFSRGKRIAAALRGQGEFPEGYRGSRTLQELTALFDACFRIQREASEAAGRYIPMVVENVRGAQPWVGRAKWSYGSYYLWGDIPALMPSTLAVKVASDGGRRTDLGNGARFTSRDCGVERCICPAECDCQNPEPINGGVAHCSESCPVHNFRPRTVPECPANKHKNGAISHWLNEAAEKVPGMNFHDFEKTGKPGRSFQSAAVAEHIKQGGATAAIKNGKDWFGSGENCSLQRKASSGSTSRRAASALIAKIPFALAEHIGRVYYPHGDSCAKDQPAKKTFGDIRVLVNNGNVG